MVSVFALAWMAGLFLASGAGPANVCVELSTDHLPAGIIEDAIVRALASRCAMDAVRVRACEPVEADLAWRVRVEFLDAQHVHIAVLGEAGGQDQHLRVAGLARHEIAQTIALAAYEILRPSLQRLMTQLAVGERKGIELHASGAAREMAPVAPGRSASIVLQAWGGPTIGLSPYHWQGSGGLAVAAPLPLADIVSRIGGDFMQSVVHEVRARAWAGYFGLGVQYRARFLSAGTGLLARMVAVQFSGNGLPAQLGRTYWDAGAYADVALSFSLGEATWLGLLGETRVWSHPRTLLWVGQPVFSQPAWDVTIGPHVMVSWP
jgi:hypothetical protein